MVREIEKDEAHRGKESAGHLSGKSPLGRKGRPHAGEKQRERERERERRTSQRQISHRKKSRHHSGKKSASHRKEEAIFSPNFTNNIFQNNNTFHKGATSRSTLRLFDFAVHVPSPADERLLFLSISLHACYCRSLLSGYCLDIVCE